MHFASTRTLAVMVVGWTLFLFGYDQHANPRPLATYWAEITASRPRRAVDSTTDRARLLLVMPRLCCEDCLGAATDALRRLSWLAPARRVAGKAALEVDILDPQHADLAAIDHVLSVSGLTAEAIEVFGMGHFRLAVELGGAFTCGGSGDDLERLVRKESQDRWLDSLVVNPADPHEMVVYPRMNASVDLMDLTRGVGRAGLAIRSIGLLTGPE